MTKSEWKFLLTVAIWGIFVYMLQLVGRPVNVYAGILMIICALLSLTGLIINIIKPGFLDREHTATAFANPLGSNIALTSSALLIIDFVVYIIV